jgi:hypothetical protein
MTKYQYWRGTADLEMKGNNCLVFGSNPQGIHGAGAALLAVQIAGAKYGQGRGLQGNAYGLVTKNLTVGYTEKVTGITYPTKGYRSVSPEQIRVNIQELYDFALTRPELIFHLGYRYWGWPNGSPKKSLNGYNSKEMWDLFTKNMEVPDNIRFHESFKFLEST